jgi:nicotinamide mononucleotide transporter
MSTIELLANGVTTLSIFLAARNSLHTWWTGMFGSALFAAVFWGARLYADVTLQAFFLATSAWGWWHWARGGLARTPRPIARSTAALLLCLGVAGVGVTAGYGSLLHTHTDAALPFADSAVLGFSIVAQGLLMTRRLETWAFWLLVNTLSVPLFWSRELHLTAGLYAVYWCNAWWGGWRWWRLHQAQPPAGP